MSDTVAPQEGKFYRTRDGRKVGPIIQASPGGTYDFFGALDGEEIIFQKDGSHGGRWVERNFAKDLVAEWTEGPVVTETVKRIVPGVYGNVSVLGSGSMSVNLKFDNGLYDSSDLRDLAATLTALADAL